MSSNKSSVFPSDDGPDPTIVAIPDDEFPICEKIRDKESY